MSTSPNRGLSAPRLRLISIAWGERYVKDFLDVCLPALLAPGNLPVLAEHFSTEVAFVTEARVFAEVRAHPSWMRTSRLCDVRLMPLDDLVATRNSYGMSLTYAFFRGFQDLGPAMTDCYLVFIHADFILADGSYRSLLPHLLRGERLVLSPSYCVISEDVRPQLLAAKDPSETVLIVPPRAMADLIVKNRHFTIRSKTVNQRFYSLRFIEQFYWVVNESTLLAHQLPIAVVAMKPERYLPDVTAYWDYGVVAEFCPSMKFAVLGDSDEFLMLELRGGDTPLEISLGWPPPDEVANRLGMFITDYKKIIGRARLTVHSQDLPPGIEEAHTDLDRYVAAVYSRLPKLLHHLDHPQWTYHFGPFHAARADHLSLHASDSGSVDPPRERSDSTRPGSASVDNAEAAEVGAAGALTPIRSTVDTIVKETSPVAPASDLLDRVAQASIDHIERLQRFETACESFRRDVSSGLAVLMHASTVLMHASRLRVLNGLEGKLPGAPDALERAELDKALADYEAERPDLASRIGVIGHSVTEFEQSLRMTSAAINELLLGEVERRKTVVRRLVVMAEQMQAAAASVRLAMPSPDRYGESQTSDPVGPVLTSSADVEAQEGRRVIRASHLLFGSSPRYRRWHWLHSSTRLALSSTLGHIRAEYDVLQLHFARPGLFAFLNSRVRSVASVPLLVAQDAKAHHPSFIPTPRFDCCVIEAELSSLADFRAIYETVRPWLKAGAVIIALFLNPSATDLPLRDARSILNAFPVCGPARIAYAGSWASVAAFRARRRLEEWVTQGLKLPGALGVAVGMLAAAPLAVIGSWIESDRTLDNSCNPPNVVTSVTIEIKVG
jgi:hypothetical protein